MVIRDNLDDCQNTPAGQTVNCLGCFGLTKFNQKVLIVGPLQYYIVLFNYYFLNDFTIVKLIKY